MKLLTLIPISQKGKQRVKEWGKTWKVLNTGWRGLFIQSITDDKGLSKRWLDQPTDSDFKIEEMEKNSEDSNHI